MEFDMKTEAVQIHNQKGQLVLEAILLTVVLLGAAGWMSKYLQESEFASKLIAKPWTILSGMIECGVWQPCGPGLHPQAMNRVRSLHPSRGQD